MQKHLSVLVRFFLLDLLTKLMLLGTLAFKNELMHFSDDVALKFCSVCYIVLWDRVVSAK